MTPVCVSVAPFRAGIWCSTVTYQFSTVTLRGRREPPHLYYPENWQFKRLESLRLKARTRHNEGENRRDVRVLSLAAEPRFVLGTCET